MGAEFVGRAADGFDAITQQPLTDIGEFERFDELAVELGYHIRWRASRSANAGPGKSPQNRADLARQPLGYPAASESFATRNAKHFELAGLHVRQGAYRLIEHQHDCPQANRSSLARCLCRGRAPG